MAASAHGFVGSHLQPFTELLPLHMATFNPHDLFVLSKLMKADFDTVKDGADPEENLWVPAGYTYFGQFVDHDLTFDSTSSLNPADQPPQGSHVPSNLRTPRFDLDNVYGDGPDAQPFMYDTDGATILTGDNDLLRAPNGRAIIGDKRNDENSIVCQIHLAMIRYHNKVVAALKGEPATSWNTPNNLFASAQNEVRWTYQLILVTDFLPRIINHKVLQDLQGHTPHERIGAMPSTRLRREPIFPESSWEPLTATGIRAFVLGTGSTQQRGCRSSRGPSLPRRMTVCSGSIPFRLATSSMIGVGSFPPPRREPTSA